MKPYYESGGITIYHGDCREILPTLTFDGLVLTDPPYGVRFKTSGRGASSRTRNVASRDWPAIAGDDQKFDPSHLLRFERLVLFGANYFASLLPASPSWIIWDKVNGLHTDKRAIGFNDMPDCELAWTNLGGPARIFRHTWMGLLRETEVGQRVLHPTQKPVALMRWILAHWSRDAEPVLDPYIGSGPTLVAAKDFGRRAIGIEIEERYCEIAARRLDQEVLELGA